MGALPSLTEKDLSDFPGISLVLIFELPILGVGFI